VSQNTQKMWEIDELTPKDDIVEPEEQPTSTQGEVQSEPSANLDHTEPPVAKKGYHLPAWFTSKWDLKQILKDNYMFFLIVAVAFGVGWVVASTYYQNLLAAAVNKAIDELPPCVDPLVQSMN